jgi:hypothetical protein
VGKTRFGKQPLGFRRLRRGRKPVMGTVCRIAPTSLSTLIDEGLRFML